MEKITFDEFKTRAEDLQTRLGEVQKLYNEADQLVKSLDTSLLTDGQLDKVHDIAYDIAYLGGYEFDSIVDGFWLPSTC